jgi:hypothetical protein
MGDFSRFLNPRKRGFFEKLRDFIVYAYPWFEPIPTDEYAELLRKLGASRDSREKEEILSQIDRLPKW